MRHDHSISLDQLAIECTEWQKDPSGKIFYRPETNDDEPAPTAEALLSTIFHDWCRDGRLHIGRPGSSTAVSALKEGMAEELAPLSDIAMQSSDASLPPSFENTRLFQTLLKPHLFNAITEEETRKAIDQLKKLVLAIQTQQPMDYIATKAFPSMLGFLPENGFYVKPKENPDSLFLNYNPREKKFLVTRHLGITLNHTSFHAGPTASESVDFGVLSFSFELNTQADSPECQLVALRADDKLPLCIELLSQPQHSSKTDTDKFALLKAKESEINFRITHGLTEPILETASFYVEALQKDLPRLSAHVSEATISRALSSNTTIPMGDDDEESASPKSTGTHQNKTSMLGSIFGRVSKKLADATTTSNSELEKKTDLQDLERSKRLSYSADTILDRRFTGELTEKLHALKNSFDEQYEQLPDDDKKVLVENYNKGHTFEETRTPILSFFEFDPTKPMQAIDRDDTHDKDGFISKLPGALHDNQLKYNPKLENYARYLQDLTTTHNICRNVFSIKNAVRTHQYDTVLACKKALEQYLKPQKKFSFNAISQEKKLMATYALNAIRALESLDSPSQGDFESIITVLSTIRQFNQSKRGTRLEACFKTLDAIPDTFKQTQNASLVLVDALRKNQDSLKTHGTQTLHDLLESKLHNSPELLLRKLMTAETHSILEETHREIEDWAALSSNKNPLNGFKGEKSLVGVKDSVDAFLDDYAAFENDPSQYENIENSKNTLFENIFSSAPISPDLHTTVDQILTDRMSNRRKEYADSLALQKVMDLESKLITFLIDVKQIDSDPTSTTNFDLKNFLTDLKPTDTDPETLIVFYALKTIATLKKCREKITDGDINFTINLLLCTKNKSHNHNRKLSECFRDINPSDKKLISPEETASVDLINNHRNNLSELERLPHSFSFIAPEKNNLTKLPQTLKGCLELQDCKIALLEYLKKRKNLLWPIVGNTSIPDEKALLAAYALTCIDTFEKDENHQEKNIDAILALLNQIKSYNKEKSGKNLDQCFKPLASVSFNRTQALDSKTLNDIRQKINALDDKSGSLTLWNTKKFRKEMRESLSILNQISCAEEKAKEKSDEKKASEKGSREQLDQIKLLLDAAIQKSIKNKNLARFDTQGRVLLETQADTLPIEKPGAKPTLCYIDVKKIDPLEKNFKEWVKSLAPNGNELETKFKSKSIGDAINSLLESRSRNSVIPLQKETEMHMRLMSRVLRKAIKIPSEGEPLKETDWIKIVDESAKKINKLVGFYFSRALLYSYDETNGKINFKGLNELLDSKRTELAKKSLEFLCDACWEHDSFKGVYSSRKDEITKTLIHATTATGVDFLSSDYDNKTLVRITATEETAHSKDFGKLANQLVHYNSYDCNHTAPLVSTEKRQNIMVRCPSIALKDKSHTMAISDVTEKFQLLQTQITDQGHSDKPITYNLLTSLHNKLYNRFFDARNGQRTSTARILKGSHAFNRKQIDAKEKESLFYVQNIPVNQHTNNLGYDSLDGATQEATLMTEIALLSTLSARGYHTKSKTAYENAHRQYVNFLQNPGNRDKLASGDLYFKDSRIGKDLIRQLGDYKNNLKDVIKVEACTAASLNTPFDELMSHVLLKIFANNYHWDKRYGMIVQAISIFLEDASVAGCKSASDRLKQVFGRVNTLRNLNNVFNGKNFDELAQEQKFLLNALIDFANIPTMGPDDLHRKLSIAFNNLNLHDASDHHAHEDMGTAPKSLASQNYGSSRITEINTNYTEISDVSNLVGDSVSAVQKADHARYMHQCFERLQDNDKSRSSTPRLGVA